MTMQTSIDSANNLVTKLHEALALSRKLVSKSGSLVAETKKVREDSRTAIDHSYLVLDKARSLRPF